MQIYRCVGAFTLMHSDGYFFTNMWRLKKTFKSTSWFLFNCEGNVTRHFGPNK
jgi:hypothetical protein